HRPSVALADVAGSGASAAMFAEAGISAVIGSRSGVLREGDDAHDLPCVRLDRITASPQALKAVIDGFPADRLADQRF
ncbi:MAG: hypothetical protein WAT70_15270, partial [Rhizobiaceae bacterium]